jgi:UvrD-like helicase C-terminal domain
VRRFIEELGAVEYPLTTNYRCRDEIVRVANRLIATDSQATGRQMRASYSGGEVVSRLFETPEQEADHVAGEIQDLVETGGIRPPEISVLARAGFGSRCSGENSSPEAFQCRIGSEGPTTHPSGRLSALAWRSLGEASPTANWSVSAGYSSFRPGRSVTRNCFLPSMTIYPLRGASLSCASAPGRVRASAQLSR